MTMAMTTSIICIWIICILRHRHRRRYGNRPRNCSKVQWLHIPLRRRNHHRHIVYFHHFEINGRQVRPPPPRTGVHECMLGMRMLILRGIAQNVLLLVRLQRKSWNKIQTITNHIDNSIQQYPKEKKLLSTMTMTITTTTSSYCKNSGVPTTLSSYYPSVPLLGLYFVC